LKASQFLRSGGRRARATMAFFAGFLLICATALPASAQYAPANPNRPMNPNPRSMSATGQENGVSAGGNWMEFRVEDPMTAAKKVRFELLANNYLSEDPSYKPRVELVCTDGKYNYADFNPGIRLGPPNRPGFWGQPQLEVEVRIDDAHGYKGWNWMRDRFLQMDKGTTRGLIGAQIFNVKLTGRDGSEIAEFSPAGLDLSRVKQACGLTPRKPSKD